MLHGMMVRAMMMVRVILQLVGMLRVMQAMGQLQLHVMLQYMLYAMLLHVTQRHLRLQLMPKATGGALRGFALCSQQRWTKQ